MDAYILLVEDTPLLRDMYASFLRGQPYRVVHASTGTEALALIDAQPPDLIVLDLQLPDMHGLDILRIVQENDLPTEVIVITGESSVEVAVKAMRAGARDFLQKPVNADRFLVTVRNALEHLQLHQMVERFQERLSRDRFHGFVGVSKPMQAVYDLIETGAKSNASVFITGESGTGKEVCAEAIHAESDRAEQPFVAVNCAAIPRDLMESELFGHVKGSFTGAYTDRQGLLSQANGGTLFLDEICEMALDLQSKLLRVLQTGEFQRVGAQRPETTDVRFVCATNRDPLTEIETGRFREDLYYRLHVIPMHLPPLRERGDDILRIAEAFLQRYAGIDQKRFKRFSPEAAEALLRYPWPGNVRELQNIIRQIVVLNDGVEVTAAMLGALKRGRVGPARLHATTAPVPAPALAPAAVRPLWQIEKEAIEAAIAACDGNISRAAGVLQINPSTIYRKQKQWGAA